MNVYDKIKEPYKILSRLNKISCFPANFQMPLNFYRGQTNKNELSELVISFICDFSYLTVNCSPTIWMENSRNKEFKSLLSSLFYFLIVINVNL